MEILLSLLIEWLALNASIDIQDRPQVKVVSQQTLTKMYSQPVHALYENKEKTIYLSKSVDLSTIEGASVLLHELIHHHQQISGAMDKFACIRQSEELAYETQRQYLKANNAPMTPELDPFNTYIRSLCVMY